MDRSFSFLLCPSGHPLRSALERGITETYARTYGAELTSFPGLLVGLFDDGNPICTAGIRSEPDGLFSQHYIEQPIHRLLNADSRRLIEVCHYAAFRRGVGPILLPRMVEIGLSFGAEWAVFTATSELRALLKRAGMPIVQLAAARRQRVPSPELWGSYYEHDPWVCAISASAVRARAGLSGTMQAPVAAWKCCNA